MMLPKWISQGHKKYLSILYIDIGVIVSYNTVVNDYNSNVNTMYMESHKPTLEESITELQVMLSKVKDWKDCFDEGITFGELINLGGR